MTDYEERYEGNGEEEELHNSHHQPHPDSSPLPTHDDLTDSKSRHGSRDYDRDSSRSRDKEREKGRDRERKREKGRDREREKSRDRDSERSRDKDRDRDKSKDRERDRDRDGEKERDRDRDRHHRDRHRDRGERRERTRDRDDDDYHRSRDFDRRRDYDREDKHRRRSRSRSQSRSGGRSEHRSRSRSRSRSKSKRTSGFDMAPPASAMLTGASAVAGTFTHPHCADNGREPTSVAFMSTEESMHLFLVGLVRLQLETITYFGQITGANPTIPGMFPNMFPLATSQMQQFSALPVMPVQAMTQQATRHARRVYVGGLPPTANEQSVATFFSQVMAKIGGNTAGPGDAVVNVYINHDKKFAFVEMRSVEEASNAMALDGIIFEGAPVKVRRPTDYNPSLAATLGPSQPNPNLNLGAVGLTPGSAGGLDGPDRVFVGGLPYYFTETQIRELLETFGPLRGFDLVKDRETGNSKGYAFCVYQDLAVTDIACAALNGIKMGDKTLTVRRANQGANPQQPKPEQESILMHAQQQIALQKLMLQPALVATKVVCLTHAVSSDELKDDEDYEEILDDMRQECSKFGTLVNVVIPRPPSDGEPAAGVGKVFLEYVDIDGATKARAGLNGRKFDGNQVVAVFYPENKFAQGDYEG
ncbi:Splicing factor U2af large subunit A [Glycine max]|uniref:Splicing factor U2af large subunit B isoform B n=3 Tax=Glycine subgen. Soja TaxID=1462606 RepID=A0A445L5J2_GLYSO|nr:Splicing factor U2af large subunit A [Glycine max]RZC18371.1 Splicing factor U2af large subunit B isoform B [Glycine soja]